jgi:hypothetical protein
MSKDAGFRIRVERELRDDFLDACRSEEKPAAQVIREFMRRYVRAERAKRKQKTRRLPEGSDQ